MLPSPSSLVKLVLLLLLAWTPNQTTAVLVPFDQPGNCNCVVESWQKNGSPSPTCLSLLTTLCSTTPTSPLCLGLNTTLLVPFHNVPFISALADYAAVSCVAPYFTMESLEGMDVKHPLYYNREELGFFVLLYGSNTLNMPADTNPTSALTFYNHDLTGTQFVSITDPQLVQIGFTMGSALAFAQARNAWISGNHLPPSQQTLAPDFSILTLDPTDVFVVFNLERLINLDSQTGEFEVEAVVTVSWRDSRIFAKCTHAGKRGAFAPDDPCRYFWQPRFVWQNLKMRPGFDDLQPTVIEDFGFTTVVGSKVTDTGGAGWGEGLDGSRSQLVETSVGIQMYRIRGTFIADLSFHDFPYDIQNLDIRISPFGDLNYRLVRLSSRAAPKAVFEGGGELDLFKTICISSFDGVNDVSKVAAEFEVGNDPYADYLRRFNSAPPDIMMSEMSAGAEFDIDNNPEFDMEDLAQLMMWSETTFRIVVRRIHAFYNLNFVLVLSMLVTVAMFSFQLPSTALDSRLSITLTVFLGINVFQIVVIDNVPNTGYVTRMHSFCLKCTAIVVFVAVQNVTMFLVNKRHTKEKRVIRIVENFVSHELTAALIAGGKGGGGEGEKSGHKRGNRWGDWGMRAKANVTDLTTAGDLELNSLVGGKEEDEKTGKKEVAEGEKTKGQEGGGEEERRASSDGAVPAGGLYLETRVDRIVAVIDAHGDWVSTVLFPLWFAWVCYVDLLYELPEFTCDNV